MNRLVGLVASVVILGAGTALADDKQTGARQRQGSDVEQGSSVSGGQGAQGATGTQEGASVGTGGASTTGTATGTTTGEPAGTHAQMGRNEIVGQVVQADQRALYLDHMGAIVKLQINKQTRFGPELKDVKNLKEGQAVRATFEVRDRTTNVATQISVSEGTGGSILPHQGAPGSEQRGGSMGGTGGTEPGSMDPGHHGDTGSSPGQGR